MGSTAVPGGLLAHCCCRTWRASVAASMLPLAVRCCCPQHAAVDGALPLLLDTDLMADADTG